MKTKFLQNLKAIFKITFCFIFVAISVISCQPQSNNGHDVSEISGSSAPIMGWSSWNNFRVNINEDIIKSQADAMVSLGLTDVGYKFINIDDGYFGGRDAKGKILSHKERFPNDMKNLAY